MSVIVLQSFRVMQKKSRPSPSGVPCFRFTASSVAHFTPTGIRKAHLRGRQERDTQSGDILVDAEHRTVVRYVANRRRIFAWDRDRREDPSAQEKSLRSLKGRDTFTG